MAVHPVSRTGGATWITRGFRISNKTKIKVKVKVNLRRRQGRRRRQEKAPPREKASPRLADSPPRYPQVGKTVEGDEIEGVEASP